MQRKYILAIGNKEEEILDREPGLLFMIDLALNFDSDPSIAALYWTVPDAAKEIATSMREDGIKVGVYADRRKAQRFFWKSVGLPEYGDAITTDTMELIAN